jgi:hypothetical protein
MSENTLKVPIVKKDAIVPIEMNYTEIACLVQGLFLIAGRWTPEQIEEFKQLLESKVTSKDPQQITYIVLDQFYRKILSKAKELDMIEYSEMTIDSPLK